MAEPAKDRLRSTPVPNDDSRREFLRGSSLLLAGAVPAVLGASPTPAAVGATARSSSCLLPQRTLRVGLIGCGRRGVQLCTQLFKAAPHARLRAVADVFEDRLQQSLRGMKSRFSEQFAIQPQHRYVGLDAFQQLLSSDVDLVVLATAPGFRPQHMMAAVDAGKHVVAARAIATDVAGVEQFLSASRLAHQKQLAVSVALDQRHDPRIAATVAQLHAGAIGTISTISTHCTAPALPSRSSTPSNHNSNTHLEDQLRNWMHFDWTGGGGMLETFVDRMDLCNWILDGNPLEAECVGEIAPTQSLHQVDRPVAITYRYAGGVQVDACWKPAGIKPNHPVQQRSSTTPYPVAVYGSRGWCDVLAGKIYDQHHQLIWETRPALRETASNGNQGLVGSQAGTAGAPAGQLASPWTWLHGAPLPQDGEHAAFGTMAAILGRTAAISSQVQTWPSAPA
ncbi:Gfo/Idh/MocA family protein [Aureliella helgolandensis]|uniref:Inositol 2-dehydrogenase/D-chiro-inositol 3-dehydrogenase n=1 Tax=Aureliella helgolandensis TaxID=2527968 RepID=A0A518G1G3_9BACT|nr:Gfo/Idh/MocA family oxidoreductase [Aureliella helgolandensis]QDV22423.1 Inositol 2-dehydrogenase/D-chiro-inositol 3-dehydrogenase [Aureliella helgolandensis]